MKRFLATVLIGLMMSSGAAVAERISHSYDMRVGALRLATADVRGVAEGGRYAVNATMQARGVAGWLTGGSFQASARGRWSGGGAFTPERFEQSSDFRGEQQELVIEYASGTPVSTRYTPARDPDEDPIPTLAKQSGTVDFLTAMLTLTFPGTAEEICARSVTAFTFTKRTLLDGTGTVGGAPDAPTCSVEYADVDPETLVADSRDTYTMDLRPLGDGRFEVERISGPSEFGRAIFQRTD